MTTTLDACVTGSVGTAAHLACAIEGINANSASIAAHSDTLEDHANGINNGWVMLCASLVLFMQCGFSMVEAGSVRANNVKSILLKNMADLCVGSLGWAITGYGIAFGEDNGSGLMGTTKFFGEIEDAEKAFFIFQLAFACTAATIVSGAVAERIKLSAYFINAFVILIVIYPWSAHWIWSENGWLYVDGFRDFAGSLVVHAVGGTAALVVALKLGPRVGRFDKQLGIVMDIPPHSMVLTSLGTWILMFGWFGFNPGSSLALTGESHLAAATAAGNTLIAAVCAVCTTIFIMVFVIGQFDLSQVMNALLAGLVAITGPCAVVSIGGAIAVGSLGGIFFAWSSHMMLHKFRLDDPVDAFCVHGISGAWGILAAGFFDIEEGLMYGGGADLLLLQAKGLVVVLGVVAVSQFTCIMILDTVMRSLEEEDKDRANKFGDEFLKLGIRVDPEVEVKGCDSEFSGSAAYSFLEQKTTLEECLADAELCQAFRQFLIQMQTDENLEFYEEVLMYETRDQHELVDAATVLYMKFFKTGGSSELNVRGGLKKQVADNLATATRKIFENAKNECLQMMRDTFTSHFQDSDELNRIIAMRKEAEAAERRPPLHCLATICCGIKRRNSDEMASMTIEEQMMDHKLEDLMTLKLLVLGAGEAGKTTLVNQLIMIFNQGVTSMAVRERAKLALRTNVFMTIKVLIRKLEEDSEIYSSIDASDKALLERCKNHDPDLSGYSLSDAEAVKAVWEMPAMKKVWNNRRNFWLLSNGEFYLENCVRFADQPNVPFVPTNRDMAKSRKKTTGVNVTSFYEKASKWGGPFSDPERNPGDVLQLKWDVVDVGGQRSERRKWMAYFDNVHAIFFVLNLNGYQEVLYEDETKLKIRESMQLFADTFRQEKGGKKGNGLNVKIPIFIVMNKVDFYKENYSPENFKTCFPECTRYSTPEDGIAHLKKVWAKIASEECGVGESVLTQFWDFDNCINAIEIDECGNLLTKAAKKTVEQSSAAMVKGLPDLMPAVKRRWNVQQKALGASARVVAEKSGKVHPA